MLLSPAQLLLGMLPQSCTAAAAAAAAGQGFEGLLLSTEWSLPELPGVSVRPQSCTPPAAVPAAAVAAWL
jgi:hypothetical protein